MIFIYIYTHIYLCRFTLHSRVSVCLLALCTRFETWQLPCSPAGRAEQWGTPDGFAAPAFPPPVPFLFTYVLPGPGQPWKRRLPPRSVVFLPGTVPLLALQQAPETRGNSVGGWLANGLFLM